MPLFPSLSRSQWRTSSTFFTFTARSETLWGMCLATRWGLMYLELEVPIITSQSRALVHPAGWTSWSLLATWSLDDLQKNTLEGILNGVGLGNSYLGSVTEYLVLLPADFVSLLLSLFLLLVLAYIQAMFFNQGFPGWGKELDFGHGCSCSPFWRLNPPNRQMPSRPRPSCGIWPSPRPASFVELLWKGVGLSKVFFSTPHSSHGIFFSYGWFFWLVRPKNDYVQAWRSYRTGFGKLD